jgi:hypothetical protein
MPCGMKLCCSASGWCGVCYQTPLHCLICIITNMVIVFLDTRCVLSQRRPSPWYSPMSGWLRLVLYYRKPFMFL